MKQFHELNKEQQTKAKDHAKGVLVDHLLDGMEIENLSLVAIKVLADAKIIARYGKKETAKAYLMQSQLFMKSVNVLIESAAEMAMYPESEDYLIEGIG